MRRPLRGWSAWLDACTRGYTTGWALAIPMCGLDGYWVGGGVVPTQYPPGAIQGPYTRQPVPACLYTSDTRVLTATTRGLRSTKEILGVNNARVFRGTHVGCVGTAATLRPHALRPLPLRLLSAILSISQLFSVFLSILGAVSLSILGAVSLSILGAVSLRISVYLSYSQYFSVFHGDPL